MITKAVLLSEPMNNLDDPNPLYCCESCALNCCQDRPGPVGYQGKHFARNALWYVAELDSEIEGLMKLLLFT